MSLVFEVRYGKSGSKPSIKAVKLNDKVQCTNDPSIDHSEIPATSSEAPKILTPSESTESPTLTTTLPPKKDPSSNSQMKLREDENNLMKSRFTIPLSELVDKNLIEVEFDREVLSLTVSIFPIYRFLR